MVFRAAICFTLALTLRAAEEALPVFPSLRSHQIKVEASLHVSCGSAFNVWFTDEV